MPAAIHDSTHPSYPSLLHMILATLIPIQQRIRVGTTVEKHVPAGSLTRAVLAWGTTVGVGLLLLKVFGKTNRDEEEEDEEHSNSKNSLWSILRDMIGMNHGCNKNNRRSKKKNSPSTPRSLFPMSSLEEVVTHEGSCHCGSIYFEVTAPRCLTLRFPQDENNDNSGDNDLLDASFDLASVVSSVRRQQGAAIHYPSAKVEASGFNLLQGQEQWKTYHVQVTRGNDNGTDAVVVTKAYSFCRVCAVHILHASDDDAFSISINVHTLTTPWTSTQEEEAKDVIYQEEEEESTTRRPAATTSTTRSSSRAAVHKQPKKPRKQKQQQRNQQQQQQRHPASAPTRNVVTPQQGDVVEISNSGSTEGAAQRRRQHANPSSSYMVPNNPLSTGVDWPVGVDEDGDAAACFEEESTISSTTTTSSMNQLLLGGESSIPAADATTATTMTSTTLESSMMEQQQQQQPSSSRDASKNNNNKKTTAAATTTTDDPVTREKLRHYMSKHLKKNKTIA